MDYQKFVQGKKIDASNEKNRIILQSNNQYLKIADK